MNARDRQIIAQVIEDNRLPDGGDPEPFEVVGQAITEAEIPEQFISAAWTEFNHEVMRQLRSAA